MASSIQHYLDQHDDIIALLDKLKVKTDILSSKLDSSIINDSQEILSKISGNLKIHLAMEDKYLYPQLLSSNNKNVVATAKKFIDEMGSLSAVFSDYIRKWSNPEKIKSERDYFISDTRAVIDAIGKRINEENTSLYPLIKSVIDNSDNSNNMGIIGRVCSAIKRIFSW